MHLLLTDRLTCPRCGPEFGLILLAEHIQNRRVLEGEVGCANCRERFLIGRGFADLRWPPGDAVDATVLGGEDRDAALRLAACLGITGGPGHVLLLGTSVRHAGALADLSPEIEWIAADGAAEGLPEREGVSRIGVSLECLPFFSGALRGAVLEGDVGSALPEAIRLLSRAARLVLLTHRRPPERPSKARRSRSFWKTGIHLLRWSRPESAALRRHRGATSLAPS